jgi:hypothetical protein
MNGWRPAAGIRKAFARRAAPLRRSYRERVEDWHRDGTIVAGEQPRTFAQEPHNPVARLEKLIVTPRGWRGSDASRVMHVQMHGLGWGGEGEEPGDYGCTRHDCLHVSRELLPTLLYPGVRQPDAAAHARVLRQGARALIRFGADPDEAVMFPDFAQERFYTGERRSTLRELAALPPPPPPRRGLAERFRQAGAAAYARAGD